MAPADSTPQGTAVDYDPFADAPLARVVPATESQREIWLAASLGACASLAYNESITLHFTTALDADALARASSAMTSAMKRACSGWLIATMPCAAA